MADLGDRKTYLGASEAAVVLGLSKYQTGYQLARVKLGMAPEFAGNAATELGHALQPIIGAHYEARTGYELDDSEAELVHPEHPWLRCHPDFRVVGRRLLMEAKTTRLTHRYGTPGSNQVPDEVCVQALLQAEIAGVDRVDIEVQETPVSEINPVSYYVERDDALCASMIERLAEYWAYIARGEMPPPESLEDMKLAFPAPAKGTYVGYDPIMAVDFHHYLEMREQRGALEKAMDTIKDRYLTVILSHDNAEGIADSEGRPLVTYRATKGRLDTRALAKDHPDLVAQYTPAVGSRRFDITACGVKLFKVAP